MHHTTLEWHTWLQQLPLLPQATPRTAVVDVKQLDALLDDLKALEAQLQTERAERQQYQAAVERLSEE